jgi:hypothetical protein
VNLNEATQHISECFSLLTTSKYPSMKVVMLLHDQDVISMVSNFIEIKQVFEVLTRGMSSCFDPAPNKDFAATCQQFLATIQPAVSSINRTTEGVVCFWDDKAKSAAMISSLSDVSVSFAIICEHMFRTISGEAGLYSISESTTIH